METEIEFIARLFGKHNPEWLKKFLDQKEIEQHLHTLANFLNQKFGSKMKSFEKYTKDHNYVDLEPILNTMMIYDLNCKTLFVNIKKIKCISIDNLLTYNEMIDQLVDNLYVLKDQIENDAKPIATTTEAYQTQVARREYYRNMSDNLQLLYGSCRIEHHLKKSQKHTGVDTIYGSCLKYIYGKIEEACDNIKTKLGSDFIQENTLKQIHKIYNGLESLVVVNIFGYNEEDNEQTQTMVCVFSFVFVCVFVLVLKVAFFIVVT